MLMRRKAPGEHTDMCAYIRVFAGSFYISTPMIDARC